MDNFNKLLEGMQLSEEAVQSIQEAWESRISSERESITAELREEFAQRYEHDKGQIAEAVDQFISDKLEAEIAELKEDKKALVAERVNYRKAVKEHAEMLDKFITQAIAKEVKELRADRQKVAEHMSKLDTFVSEMLAEELKEFHADKQALAEQKVKMIREGKKRQMPAWKDRLSETEIKMLTFYVHQFGGGK